MTFTTSYVNGYTLAQILMGGTHNLDTDAIGVHLFTDAITGQDKNASEAIVGTATMPYGTSARVSYSGATPSTFGQLANPVVTVGSGKLIFGEQSAGTLQWTGASWTARGCAVFDNTVAGTPVLAAINFGADVPVSTGTFTITWDATNKIFYATY